MDTTPDKWILLYVGNNLHKVFASWKDKSWRLNSGIISVEEDDKYFYFNGVSGSRYQCRKNKYGIIGNYTSVLISMWMESSRGDITVLEEEEALEIINTLKKP